MPQVDIRWRSSGGRGEYEHVPSDVLMDRRVVVEPLSVAGARILTDVRGARRDGKPRLRRDDGNDRGLLNLHALVAALALFPDPARANKGAVSHPLRDKGYVISSVTFHVEYSPDGDAICTPLRMEVLHDTSVINLFERLRAVGRLLNRSDLPARASAAIGDYRRIVEAGKPLASLRTAADELRRWLDDAPVEADALDEVSVEIAPEPAVAEKSDVKYEDMEADETKRRLVSHYRIERDRKIVAAKRDQFLSVHGRLFCEACEFDFNEKYGEYAKNIIDVHHMRPLATLLPNTMTRLSDLMLLCANCHRVVHRRKTPLSRGELLALIDAQKKAS